MEDIKLCGNCIDFKECSLIFFIKENEDASNCDQYLKKKKHDCPCSSKAICKPINGCND